MPTITTIVWRFLHWQTAAQLGIQCAADLGNLTGPNLNDLAYSVLDDCANRGYHSHELAQIEAAMDQLSCADWSGIASDLRNDLHTAFADVASAEYEY